MTTTMWVALAVLVGARLGTDLSTPVALRWMLLSCGLACLVGGLAWARWASAVRIVPCGVWVAARARRLGLVSVVMVVGTATMWRAAGARDRALDTDLRAVLDAHVGGFRTGTLGPESTHAPVRGRGLLVEDASADPPGARLRVRMLAVYLESRWHAVDGGVWVSVGGSVGAAHLAQWRRGRTIEAPLTFRRPQRYLNAGVPDFERALALGGTTLFGSVKSAWLVDVVATGSWTDEKTATVRALVRQVIARWVTPHSAESAAIVAALLIGDRAGLPDETRERLQAAGIYHVLAISGGNIAILVAALLFVPRLVGMAGRLPIVAAMVLLFGYGQVVVAGPSVARAIVMALLYLGARLWDLRTASWHAMALAAIVAVASDPLSTVDAGFALTFLATAALLVAGAERLAPPSWPAIVRWILGAVALSVAIEAVLLPVHAVVFGRITALAVMLNLAAIPLMTLVQVSGFALGTGALFAPAGEWAGWLSHVGAVALVACSRLADALPWLTTHVPAPPVWLVAWYYVSGALALWGHGARRLVGGGMWVVTALTITAGWWLPAHAPRSDELSVMMFDVGQGEAMLVRLPNGESMLVDTGGVPFGGGAFDIGDRVLRPALWARGVRRIDYLLITHGDPDHIGGAQAIVESFGPTDVLAGVPVANHATLARFEQAVTVAGSRVRHVYAGARWQRGEVELRVLAPPVPDWERRRVRNDDSVVIELRYRDVAVLLTGDISGEVERTLVPSLSMAPVRVLKVAHHGSRTSSSGALVEGWRPQVALVSCGRGNRFGHPAPEVVARLAGVGARVYRTDRHGAVTLTTDGWRLQVETRQP